MPPPVPAPRPRPGTRSPPPRRVLARLAIAVAAVAAAACGGAGPDGAVPATEAEWARAVMTDLYLYADRVPRSDPSGATDAAAVLAALRVDPPDRFSYVERREVYERYFDEGRSVGLGIGYRVEAGTPVLRFVMPESPAGHAGLRRGDRIVSIDGVDPATLADPARVADAFGPAEPGVAVTLGIERAGVRSTRTITKAEYPISPVLEARIVEHAGRRVGYVALFTFVESTRAAWEAAIAPLRAAGVRELVVDLRDNGGGRLAVAAEVAATLLPPAAAGRTFARLSHNARHAAADRTVPLPTVATAGGFDRVAWLVSDATCSAAETLIAGMRPYRDDPVIGTATCGKPVGFEPQVRGDTVLSAVTFSSVNADGLTDWFDGLAPACTVADEPYRPLGDPADPRLAQALLGLAAGACGASAKSAPPPRAPTPSRPDGLRGSTGLH